MALARWLTVGWLVLAGTAGARAQVFFNPYGGPAFSGVRVKHHRHHRSLVGYLGGSWGFGTAGTGLVLGPYSPTGVMTVNRVQVIVPPPTTTIIINNSVHGDFRDADGDDMSPIDLDTTDPVTMKPRKPPPEEPERPAVARRPEPERPRLPPPEPPMPPAKEEPEDNVTDPVELGKRAFANREYGLAAQRFRQAAQADLAAPLPQFLLARAQFALGKYRDAFEAIRAGLDLKRDWPRERFPPRDLYKGNDVEFLGHLKRLEDLVEKHPNDPVLLFVLAYELWFDGRRDKARALFRKVRKLLPDPAYADRFLKAPG
jgi:hypothetical protein